MRGIIEFWYKNKKIRDWVRQSRRLLDLYSKRKPSRVCRPSRLKYVVLHQNIIALSLFFVLGNSLTSQAQEQGKPDERLRLIHADVLRNKKIQGKTVRQLEGNVHFQQGEVNMFCQRAIQFVGEHKVVFENQVKIDDGQRVLRADKVIYFENLKIEKAVGNVQIIEGDHTLEAQKVTYYEDEDKAIAEEKVTIVIKENNVTLTGGRAEYHRGEDYALVTIDPVLIKKDSTENEDIRVTGKKMELFEGGKRALVQKDVVITKGQTVAHCGEAEYLEEENKVLLRQHPIVWRGKDQLTGNEIELFFQDMKLVKVHVIKDALVTSKVDTLGMDDKTNQLMGEDITLFFQDDQLTKAVVQNRAISYYHIIEDGEYKGLNKIMGDGITLFLSDGELERIKVESNPGSSSGIYYPPGQTKTIESEIQKVTNPAVEMSEPEVSGSKKKI